MGRPKIDDDFKDIPSRQIRWAKRNPDKTREIRRRYLSSPKGKASQKRYREKLKNVQ